MQLSALVTAIQDELNKGTSISDSQVRTKIEMALQSIELMRDWTYMKVVEEAFAIVAASRTITAPTNLKAFAGVRFIDADGNRVGIKEVDPEDITEVEVAEPQGYIKSGIASIVLDNTPDQNYDGYWDYYGFTTWSAADAFEPFPFKRLVPLVFYQTLVYLAPFAREPQLLQMWTTMLNQAIKTAVDADEELKLANKPAQMQFK